MGCLKDVRGYDDLLEQIERNADMEKTAVVATTEEMEGRLRDLRTQIKEAKVDWYVVPSEDEHQSEFIGESDERRSWISGFTGSAGTALVPADEALSALLFVDSRYWVQAGKQVSPSWEIRKVGAKGGSGKDGVMGGWIDAIVNEIPEGSRIGMDPKLIALTTINSAKAQLEDSTTKLVPISTNLVDRIRTVPARSLDPIVPHSLKFAGNATSSKLAVIRESLNKTSPRNDWVYIIPSLPTIAWLLNIRCPGDIPFIPVVYAYAVLTPTRVMLFVDERKVDDNVRKILEKDNVEILPYGVDSVGKAVKEAVKSLKDDNEKKRIKLFAPKELSWALADAVSPSNVAIITCPIDIAKAIKNPTEVKGFKAAYTRDGRAMVKWLAWLEDKLLNEKRPVGEWAAAQALLRFRKQEEYFAGLAYGDISGSGPNGALPHYEPTRGTDRVIDVDASYVIDSGGQYLDGTIDTTRTIYFGKSPSEDLKRAYTRVLQCHIAAATAVFPKDVDADKLVMLGKSALYEDGLDYGHGLGHGIGHYLGVHEYPMFQHGVSPEPGHITSIEPGFYNEGQWGIRTESVYVCTKVETKYQFGGDRWLGWERITQVPIMTNMVDWNLMFKHEIQWLNDHNTAVKDTLEPLLDGDENKQAREWLIRVTKPKKIWPWTGRS